MERLPERVGSQPAEIVEADRQLPSGANKVERITQHTKGLVEDLTSWVELKLKLTQIEIEEKIDAKVNRAAVGVIVGVMALITALFALITLALGIGAWLGHPAWGFLVVTLLLALITGVIIAVKPHLIPIRQQPSEKKQSESETSIVKA